MSLAADWLRQNLRGVGLCAVTAIALLLPANAFAQAYQCRMPQSVTVPKVTPDSKPRRLPVTGYTFAISWSPEFCKGREMQARHRTQCSGRNGRFGFVAHGLWPESRGSWPQWCHAQRTVSPQEARRNLCMMPSTRLVARQWAKHGSCMTRRPETYFKVTRILWNSLRWPDTDRLSRQDRLTAGDLRDAFTRANPGWPRDAVGIRTNRRGWLQELRLCYGKDFRPKTCDSRRFGARDRAQLKVWRGL